MKRATVLATTGGALATVGIMVVGINADAQSQSRAGITNLQGSECVNLIVNVWTCMWTFKDGTKCVVTGTAGQPGGTVCGFRPD